MQALARTPEATYSTQVGLERSRVQSPVSGGAQAWGAIIGKDYLKVAIEGPEAMALRKWGLR